MVGFPSLLERCISGIDSGRISAHLLCSSLNNMAALFSVYYHRVKILTVKIQTKFSSLMCMIVLCLTLI